MATVSTSNQFTLNTRDIVKGLIMAVILPVLTIIQSSIANGVLTFDWKVIGIAAVSGFVAYIIKNFFSPAEIVLTNPSKATVDAVKEGDARVTITKT